MSAACGPTDGAGGAQLATAGPARAQPNFATSIAFLPRYAPARSVLLPQQEQSTRPPTKTTGDEHATSPAAHFEPRCHLFVRLQAARRDGASGSRSARSDQLQG